MRKKEIIDTAFRVWGRDYYRKTSLSQLAKELKVSKPALYRHFLSKKALIDAMAECFFDDFSAAVRADFEKAHNSDDPDEGIFLIIQSIACFFAQNAYILLFTLINIYDRNLDGRTISDHIKIRGADMNTLYQNIKNKYSSNPSLVKLIFATLILYMTNFHRINNSFEKQPSAEQIKSVISSIYSMIKKGLDFDANKTGALDFEKLEKQVEATFQKTEIEPLFKAVAEAVAEAGPWDASMDMVAKRMGLSKSSLYGHFKNKKDMLRRLFLSEFTRIMEFARQGLKLSEDTAEQLYLGIYSIAVYLRSRPEILIAMDWIRVRKLDLGEPEENLEVFRLFEDIKIESLHNAGEEEKQLISHWILFLLINTLTRFNLPENQPVNYTLKNVHNDDIHVLYKFITSGLGGFIK
jgi:AcrR family transcriptional regulator